MKKVLHGSLAMAISFAAILPVLADEVTTVQTTTPAAPQVLDSYMKPTVTQTKSVTTSDGNTQTSTAPMIMERHETVAVPTEDVVKTTTVVAPKVTTETYVAKKVCHKRVAHVVRRPVVAHRIVRRPSRVAYVHKVTTVQPEVIRQTQVIEHKGVIIDRKDPALQ
jgi:hypothetical protein